jgi:hypothetical protein
MALGYRVIEHGPNGTPARIQCATHPDCTWQMASPGAKSEDDPVYRIQFEQHLRDVADPGLPWLGHERRRRT